MTKKMKVEGPLHVVCQCNKCKAEKMNYLELAQECQLIGMRPHLDGIYQEALEKFAALVEAAARADERGRMCKQCKECLNEKSTSNEANKSAVLGEGGQTN